MPKTLNKLKIEKSKCKKNIAPDQYVPEDEKIPLRKPDPEELPEDDPFQNAEEEPPLAGEGP